MSRTLVEALFIFVRHRINIMSISLTYIVLNEECREIFEVFLTLKAFL